MKKVIFILAVSVIFAACSSPKSENCCGADSTKKDSVVVKLDSTKVVVDSVAVDSLKK